MVLVILLGALGLSLFIMGLGIAFTTPPLIASTRAATAFLLMQVGQALLFISIILEHN